MSNENSSRTVNPFKERAGQKEDKIDILRSHIVDGREIEDRKIAQEAQVIKQIWPIIIEEISWKAIVEKIDDLNICKRAKCVYYVRLAEKVYGRVREADKLGRRAILVEIALTALKKAHDAGDYKAVDRLIDKVAKLEGVYQTEDNTNTLYQTLILPEVNLSSDPKVLDAQHLEIETDE